MLNGRIKLESGSYIQWPDDTTSTTSVSGGGENPYYSQAKTFGSTLTVTGNAFSVGGATFAVTGGKVGIGTTSPGQKLTVTGTIESTSGGIKFPDASVQTTAFTGAGTTFVSTNAIITADYTLGTTPFVCVPGSTATFTANGGRLMMHFVGINLNAATANDKPKMGFLVNGAQVAPWNAFTGSIQGMWGGYNGGGFNTSPNGSWTTLTNVSAGTTSVCVYAYRQSASGATLTCNIVLGGCVLGVTEIK
ncbi:MAG: hypothetical protein A2506_11945 [Elusimicrobia bacterium RIFOXYD12_FULL_66_9]|nr:MAG: hypothetical protein A2506_11945 [Elusimicrobia bacterium RIFOXYD12_FULL_66_9]